LFYPRWTSKMMNILGDLREVFLPRFCIDCF
jgi:hypothetical protein